MQFSTNVSELYPLQRPLCWPDQHLQDSISSGPVLFCSVPTTNITGPTKSFAEKDNWVFVIALAQDQADAHLCKLSFRFEGTNTLIAE